MSRLLLPIAVSLLAGACANYAPVHGSTAAYDGKYVGLVNYAHVSAATCASLKAKPAEIVVQDGAVVWANTPSKQTMYAPVSEEGTFGVNENGTWLAGKVNEDGTLVARTNTGTCHLTYNLKKNV